MSTTMFDIARNPATVYRKLGLETSVSHADPHALIGMLYDGGLTAIGQARTALREGRVAAKGEATGRAVRIIEEGLKASLDLRAGELASNLHALYEYMAGRLLSANLHDDDACYAEVSAMLGQLADAWKQIAPQARAGGIRQALGA
jgi:flagellar protein FliS